MGRQKRTEKSSQLRRWYATALFSFVALLMLLAVGVAKVFVLNVDGLLIGLMTVGPALRWAIREGNRHRALADRLDKLCGRVKTLQNGVIEGRLSSDDARQASRELQDSIYDHRSTAPIGINWIYKLSRRKFETGMRLNAAEDVSEYRVRRGIDG